MPQRKPSMLIVVGVVACAIAAASLIFWPRQTSVRSAPLPNPNAFDLLVHAGSLVRLTPEDVVDADSEMLDAYVEANEEALGQTRQALHHDSWVPIDYSAGSVSQALDAIGTIRQAARLLLAEARRAELEGPNAAAAQAYLDVINLSQKMSRGGLIVHLQASMAYERVAWEAVLRIAPQLQAEERARFLKRFDSLGYRREMRDAYQARERALSIARNGWLMTKIMGRAANQVVGRVAKDEEQLSQLRQKAVQAIRGELDQ